MSATTTQLQLQWEEKEEEKMKSHPFGATFVVGSEVGIIIR